MQNKEKLQKMIDEINEKWKMVNLANREDLLIFLSALVFMKPTGITGAAAMTDEDVGILKLLKCTIELKEKIEDGTIDAMDSNAKYEVAAKIRRMK